MKIFRNGICYVDYTDLTRFPLPRCIMNEASTQFVIEDDFLIFKDEDSLTYLKNNAAILDYDEVANLSNEEIDKLYQESKKKLNYYAKIWLDTPGESRRRLCADKEYSKNYELYDYRTKDLKNYIDNKEALDKRIDRQVNPNSKSLNEDKVLRYKVVM